MPILKNSHGSVSAYTRHISSCVYVDAPGHTACRCPKWIYVHKRGETPQRYSLSTPSWAEAQEIAADILKGFDPEIAEARLSKQVKKQSQTTFDEAIKLWEARPNGGKNKYPDLTLRLKTWAEGHGVMHVQGVTTVALEKWYASKAWTGYAETTLSQRWGIMRSFFGYLTERKVLKDNPISPIRATKVSRDHVQGPYTDDQVNAIMSAVATETARHTWAEEAERVQLFIELLLNIGCDVVDAVLHQPNRIKDVLVSGHTVPVYRYKRTKTKVAAIIPLDAVVAGRMRSVPLVPGYTAGMPFRGTNPNLRMVCEMWERRIKYCIRASGVKAVLLPGLDSYGHERTHPANVKQFRHTFAVRQLIAGQRPEEVARMLGHVSTEMVRRHYAPWVEELDDAFLLQVIKNR